MRYKSYILRVWQRQDANGSEWAGSLEQIQAAAHWRFHTLEQLLAQLRRLAEADGLHLDRHDAAQPEPRNGAEGPS